MPQYLTNFIYCWLVGGWLWWGALANQRWGMGIVDIGLGGDMGTHGGTVGDMGDILYASTPTHIESGIGGARGGDAGRRIGVYGSYRRGKRGHKGRAIIGHADEPKVLPK